MPIALPTVELVQLPESALRALAGGDLVTAATISNIDLSGFIFEHRWLWQLRLAQYESAPLSIAWIARIVLNASRTVVGLAGFHGEPDDTGAVEVSYAIDPAFRRRGFAQASLAAAIKWAHASGSVRLIRASVSPLNEPSRAVLEHGGFALIGEQWDNVDGQELVYEYRIAV